MRLMVCLVDENPCQVANQATISMTEAIDPAMYGIDAPTIAKVYTWGFLTILFCWTLGYVIGLAIGLIRKV